MMDILVVSTFILAIWGALGPLVGVRYGQILARRWQKEHFVREGKKQEYREVLQTLSTALAPIIQSEMERGDHEVKGGISAENVCHEVLESCIFIAAELKTMNVYDRWGILVEAFRQSKDDKVFAIEYKKLADNIRESALEAIELE